MTAMFPTRSPLDVLPLATPKGAMTTLASVTMTNTYRPPAAGWPPVDMLGRPMDVDLVTVTVTVCADGTAEAPSLVSVRSADSGVVWTERPNRMPAFVGDLIGDAIEAAHNVIRGAR